MRREGQSNLLRALLIVASIMASVSEGVAEAGQVSVPSSLLARIIHRFEFSVARGAIFG